MCVRARARVHACTRMCVILKKQGLMKAVFKDFIARALHKRGIVPGKQVGHCGSNISFKCGHLFGTCYLMPVPI